MSVVDFGTLYNMQAQYDLSVAGGRQQFIMGVDVELLRPDTEGTILGRNEEEDAIDEYGVYLQSTTNLTSKFDFTMGLRGDFNNIVEKFQLSPRVALVYKVSPAHSIRATFNRAFSSPGTNQNFLDIVARQPDATLPITLRGRGSAFGYTFQRNASYGAIAGSDLVASSLIPGMVGSPMPVGLPLDTAYDAMYAGIAGIPTEHLAGILQANGIPIDVATTGLLVSLLSPAAGTTVQGFSQGQMALLNLTTLGVDPVNDVVDVAPIKQTTSQTIEAGYKGVFNNRVLLAVDAYYTTKKDFVGPLVLETPFVLVPNLTQDLTAAIASGIAGNAPLAGALGLMGLPPEMVAGLMVGLAADQLPSASTPIAIVQPEENNPGVGTAPELLLTYRNYGDIAFWGTDISTQINVNDQLSLFGNLSYVSDDLFEGDELGEGDTDLKLALNASTVKAKGGFKYTHDSGLSLNASGRYTKGFPVLSGPYVGDLESYFLLDVGMGYDFSQYAPGLRFDVMVQNALDDRHREFIGAPLIGRMGMARFTFTM